MPYRIDVGRERCTRRLACAEAFSERAITSKFDEKDVSQNVLLNYAYFARMFGYPVQARKHIGRMKRVNGRPQGNNLSVKKVGKESRYAKLPFYHPRRHRKVRQ